jgi:hypothetical protein
MDQSVMKWFNRGKQLPRRMREALRRNAECRHPLAAYNLSRAQRQEIERRFTYHAPKPDQVPRYEEIRNLAAAIAVVIYELTPTNREQSLALAALEDVVSHANAAIARGERT